jgi:hypothetical protein
MRLKVLHVLSVAVIGIVLALSSAGAMAQRNANTARGEMKESGREVGRAGSSMGHEVRHRHPIRGGKRFGTHMGRAGRHFGRGSRRTVRRNKNM